MFNQVNCIISSKNTGFSRCTPNPGQLKYEIAVPRGTRISAADADDMMTYLETLLTNDKPTERGYLLGSWVTVTDETVDPTREAYDHGVDSTIADGALIWVRRINDGALCSHLNLRKFNKSESQYEFLAVFASSESSAKYYIAGRRVVVGGIEYMSGYQYDDIWAPTWRLATGTTTSMYTLRTVMGRTDQFNEDFMFVPVDFQVGDLPRVQDIALTATLASAGNVDVNAYSVCGNSSLADLYGSTLNDDAAWVVENEDGDVVAVTGVTIVSGKYRLALDTTDPNYTSGTKFRVKLAPLSVLSTTPFNIEWIESGLSNYVNKS